MTTELPPPNVAITDKLVTVPWYNFFKDISSDSIFYNSRDYGAVGNGTADDTNALQGLLDAVCETGGIAYIQPGIYKTTSLLTLTKAPNVCVRLFGEGAWIRPSTTLADYALSVTYVPADAPRGNADQVIIDGLGFDHTLSTDNVGSIINRGQNRVSFRNIRVSVAGSVNAGFAGITITKDTDSGHFALWNDVRDCTFHGDNPAANMVFGVLVKGLSNATRIENNNFHDCDFAVFAAYTDAITGAVPDSLWVIGNYFEICDTGVDIQSVNPGSTFSGGRVVLNRFESVTKCISFGELYSSAGTGLKPFIGPNAQTLCTTFVHNPNSVEWYDLSTATLRTDTAASTDF